MFTPTHLGECWRRIRTHPVTGKLRHLAVGIDGTRSDVFEARLEQNIAEISRLINRTSEDGLPAYHFGTLLQFNQVKPSGGFRKIYVPRIRDQLVLRAIHEDITLTGKTKGLRLNLPPPAQTVHNFRAALKATGGQWLVRTDIQGFFDSVPRSQVIEEALKLGIRPISAGLLKRWSESVKFREPWTSGKSADTPIEGLPQGLSLAVSLAELWGAKLDSLIPSNLPFFRYVDDIVVICHSEKDAEGSLDTLRKATQSLHLRLSEPKTRISHLSSGVSWLGLTHFPDCIKVEPERVQRWLMRFAAIKRQTTKRLQSISPEQRPVLLAEFHRALRDEVRGYSSARPAWYCLADSDHFWKQLDSSVHAMIRSVHRHIGVASPRGRQLPSIHRAILSRKKAIISAPSNANQGPCVTPSHRGGTKAD